MKKKLLCICAMVGALAAMVFVGCKKSDKGDEGGKTAVDNQLTFTYSDYAYGGSAGEPNITVKPYGNAKVSYVYEGINGTVYELSETAPTLIGDYKITGTTEEVDGYTSVSYSTSFSITGEPLAFTFPTYATVEYGKSLAEAELFICEGDGVFAFEDMTTPQTTVGVTERKLTFTPTDTRYAVRSTVISVTVEKLVVTSIAWPTAGSATYGASLADISLTGGSENGTFAWEDPSVIPTVKNHGFRVVFTPNDTDIRDYSNIELIKAIPVTLTKAAAPSSIVFPVAGAIGYGATLNDAYLSGDYTNYGGYFEWKNPMELPVPDNSGYDMYFYADVENYDYSGFSGLDDKGRLLQKVEIVVTKGDAPLPQEGLVKTFYTVGETEAEARDYLKRKYVGYAVSEGATLVRRDAKDSAALQSNTLSVCYNPDEAKYYDHTYSATVYWESASAIQTAASLTDKTQAGTYFTDTGSGSHDGSSVIVPVAAGSTEASGASATYEVTSSFKDNDTLHITGSGTGYILLVWHTSKVAYCSNANMDCKPYLYIDNDNGLKSIRFDWQTGRAVATEQGLNFISTLNSDTSSYWLAMNAPITAGGSATVCAYSTNSEGYIAGNANNWGPNENFDGQNKNFALVLPLYVDGDFDFTITLAI